MPTPLPLPMLPESLERKLAAVVWYLESQRSKLRDPDVRALNSYLDDPEVAGWVALHVAAGTVWPNRFISK